MIGDGDLIRLLRDEPEKGLADMMDNYLGFVYTIVSGKLESVAGREDIEECTSDVFYAVFQSRKAMDASKGSVKALLATVAKRKAIDKFRRLTGQANQPLRGALPLEQEELWPKTEGQAAENQVEAAVTARETGRELVSQIEALGPPDSEIFIRKYYFGQSTKAIAQALDIKENTIDKKISRGLDKLKLALGGVL
ncbi:MAG: sigma-70 family RNA polymerase sigma factor [Dehalobacter sp.]|nr:sigma-70 family RNA polymerase sigma factor [Dehalobacter sp.]